MLRRVQVRHHWQRAEVACCQDALGFGRERNKRSLGNRSGKCRWIQEDRLDLAIAGDHIHIELWRVEDRFCRTSKRELWVRISEIGRIKRIEAMLDRTSFHLMSRWLIVAL